MFQMTDLSTKPLLFFKRMNTKWLLTLTSVQPSSIHSWYVSYRIVRLSTYWWYVNVKQIKLTHQYHHSAPPKPPEPSSLGPEEGCSFHSEFSLSLKWGSSNTHKNQNCTF